MNFDGHNYNIGTVITDYLEMMLHISFTCRSVTPPSTQPFLLCLLQEVLMSQSGSCAGLIILINIRNWKRNTGAIHTPDSDLFFHICSTPLIGRTLVPPRSVTYKRCFVSVTDQEEIFFLNRFTFSSEPYYSFNTAVYMLEI